MLDPFNYVDSKEEKEIYKVHRKYDYIICSEVIEDFHNPYDEFKSLSNMLN